LGRENERELLATAERANAGKDVGSDSRTDRQNGAGRGDRMIRAGLGLGRLLGHRGAYVPTGPGEGDVGPA
jgi:hypothetical protein